MEESVRVCRSYGNQKSSAIFMALLLKLNYVVARSDADAIASKSGDTVLALGVREQSQVT